MSEHLVMHHVTLPAPGHQSLRSDASVVVFNESRNESLKDRQDNCAGGENTDHDRALLTTTTRDPSPRDLLPILFVPKGNQNKSSSQSQQHNSHFCGFYNKLMASTVSERAKSFFVVMKRDMESEVIYHPVFQGLRERKRASDQELQARGEDESQLQQW